MSGNAVGFAFQADVTNTGSLLHSLTGRALKAMSDGGVDFYSVVATIALGKNIAVRDSLGNAVYSHIMSKGGLQSVLSKALSIGWGHKALAVEMASTKAGTNALLLVGALATGSSHFQAAQCFSELLSLRGCEPDRLPNVDMLKHMIGYIAPFVYDLGFSKVLENVSTTTIRLMRAANRDSYEPYNHLTTHGDAAGVAGGINQLLLTSQKRESYYFVTKMRGAWFAAFATHILGMSVELRLNDAVLWASAGENGTAIFELGEHQIAELSVRANNGKWIELVDSTDPTNQVGIVLDYLVGEMFGSMVAQEPRIDPIVWDAIRHGIVQITHQALETDETTRAIQHEDALKETLEAFGLNFDYRESCQRQRKSTYYLSALDENIQNTLITTCGKHAEFSKWDSILGRYDRVLDCICLHAETVMRRLVVCITNLTRCRFDASCLRIRQEAEDALSPGYYYHNWDSGKISLEESINNIYCFVCDDGTAQFKDNRPAAHGFNVLSHSGGNILGRSGGGYTVFYTSIMQNDCYDNQGRFISLWPGTASINGVARSSIVEDDAGNWVQAFPQFPTPTSSIASGLLLEPHYCPSDKKIHMSVSLDEDYILVYFTIGPRELITQAFSFTFCISCFIKLSSPHCSHDPKEGYRVEEDQCVAVVGFDRRSCPYVFGSGHTKIFALHGNKLEQIVTAGHLTSSLCVLQRLACLRCCIKLVSAVGESQGGEVIMGG
ncbi:uncharacterized protein GGS22DRAFT_135585 [Annulohypoxylon maeteangense]|uniref:uncharacterized protein n=1 Tax=Annulohypoxylon maeteangense TaxID=1927788 RepID=UPI0020077FCE|nr:uncharacterized protein GGS22DRAFT_135585 [Annulohypoxylon maeteangense]KAI0885889.1 hypothetical protein GGS22DRAFT_135585 [Annulohypoxylon maeteangense]